MNNNEIFPHALSYRNIDGDGVAYDLPPKKSLPTRQVRVMPDDQGSYTVEAWSQGVCLGIADYVDTEDIASKARDMFNARPGGDADIMLKDYRLSTGISQAKAAAMLGIATITVSKIENNAISLGLVLYKKIEGLYNSPRNVVIRSLDFSPEHIERLKALRRDHGMSLKEMAGLLGITPRHLISLEKGVIKHPRGALLVKIAELLSGANKPKSDDEEYPDPFA